ncbi:GIY-YIG nuclease family protein [candidate division WOR-3 bacterium]|uniref:GIY-YIG nuclease family protein n=1 Tax=candidate division WOR-3 bacterium TaxID=2052148 RepID=A0A660SIX8_UNCW3|nr:MAG: GIY-YIG nuclease family protein [candidate division WOR-3 bacterium]
MYYVYILRSRKYKDKIYIGFTSNLRKRLKQHSIGMSCTTRKMLSVELVYCEAYKSKADAQARERRLKQYGNALGHLKKRISNSLA